MTAFATKTANKEKAVISYRKGGEIMSKVKLNPNNKESASDNGIVNYRRPDTNALLSELTTNQAEQSASHMHKHLISLIGEFESGLPNDMQVGMRLASYPGSEFIRPLAKSRKIC